MTIIEPISFIFIFKESTLTKIHFLRGYVQFIRKWFFLNALQLLFLLKYRIMAQDLTKELYFYYNSSYTKTQLIFLFLWSCLGLSLILLTPYFFISYIIPVLGFSLFIYLLKAYKRAYLTIKGHQLSYGTLYKTVIDLRTVGRIKSFGGDYIFKTDDKNYTFRSKYLDKNERRILHEFFIQYADTQEVIFP